MYKQLKSANTHTHGDSIETIDRKPFLFFDVTIFFWCLLLSFCECAFFCLFCKCFSSYLYLKLLASSPFISSNHRRFAVSTVIHVCAFMKCTVYSCCFRTPHDRMLVLLLFCALFSIKRSLISYLFLSSFNFHVEYWRKKNSYHFWRAFHIPSAAAYAAHTEHWHVAALAGMFMPPFNQLIRRHHTSCTWFSYQYIISIGLCVCVVIEISSHLFFISLLLSYSVLLFIRLHCIIIIFNASRVQIQFLSQFNSINSVILTFCELTLPFNLASNRLNSDCLSISLRVCVFYHIGFTPIQEQLNGYYRWRINSINIH